MSSVNLKKLADELKVSVSTVSRALRDSHEISSETKQKVLSLAAKLNYQPNPYASSLRNQKSLTIAVVVPEIANNFFSLAINGIEEIAYLNGYHVLIYLTHDDYNKEVFSKNQDVNIQLIKNLLDSANPPTGIFASVEKLALTMYNVSNEMSLKYLMM